jgi:uncharacterized protein
MSNHTGDEKQDSRWQKLRSNSIWRSPGVLVPLYIASVILIVTAINNTPLYPYMYNTGVSQGYRLLISELLFVVAGFVPMYAIAKFRKEELNQYGLTRDGLFKDTALGFGLGFILVLLTVGILKMAGSYQWLGQNTNVDLVLPLIICLIVGIAEELIFRGFIFNTIEKGLGTSYALVITSVLFAGAHLLNPVPLNQRIIGCLALVFEAGLLFNSAYLINRRLWLPIGIHCAWDFFEGPFFGMVVSGVDISKPFYQAKLVGDFMQTGGDFGPEASLTGFILGTTFGVILLIVAIKRRQWIDRPTK